MLTLEDFQNILQSTEQERIQQSPLYQRVTQEQMREQQKMQEIPQELMPVFDELRGAQERNEVRDKLQRYNTAIQYCGGGRINKFDGVTGPSDMNTFVQMNPITGWQPEYYKDFGIGNHPAFDEDFRTRYGLRYAPYSEIDFGGTSPDNIRVQNQNNMTAQAFQWSNPTGTLLVGPDNRIINQQRLTELSNQYRRDNAEMLNRRYAKALSEKPLEQKNPEFYLLAGSAHALQSAANKGLTAAFVDPMMNMEMIDAGISNTTPYSGWGNMMAENAGGPEWAWDLAHPAFAKDLWNLTKAAGKGAYNWMAEHTPESAYNFGIRPENPFANYQPFDWDEFVRNGGFVDEAMAGNISDDALRAANSSRTAATDVANESTRTVRRPAYLSGTPTEDDAIQQLMRQHGMSRAEAEDVLHINRDFEDFWGNELSDAEGTGVEDLLLPEPPAEINLSPNASEIIGQPGQEAVGQAARDNSYHYTSAFPDPDEVSRFMDAHPEYTDFDTAQDAVFQLRDPALFTRDNRQDLISDFVNTYGVSDVRAAREVDQILDGVHPEFRVKGLSPKDIEELPSYEEIMKDPSLLDPYMGRLSSIHPNLPAGTPPEAVKALVHNSMKEFDSRPPLSTYEQLGFDFSGSSAPAILGNIQGVQAAMIREGKFPGIMTVKPAVSTHGVNTLNPYGAVNWGTPEAPFNPYLHKIKEGLYRMPYGFKTVTDADIAGWKTAEQVETILNRKLQRIFDQYAPYSEEVRNFGADNFKVTLDRDKHQFVVPEITWVFDKGGHMRRGYFNDPYNDINILAKGGSTNDQQLWNRARPLYNELIMAGVPHMAAIGVLGNIALESGVNPNASNKVNGGHWGYTQNDKAITDHIKKYYGGNGHREQMQFLKDGLTGQIRGAKQAPWLQKRFDEYRQGINGVNDPAKAALMWEKYYEKSTNEALDKRADYAKYFHNALGSPDYQYSPDKYNSRAGLGPLVGQTTEEETPEQAPWYNQYQLNDADYAALYEQNNTLLPMFDTSLAWNPMQPGQQGGGFPNLFAGGGYIEDGLRSLGVNGFKVTSGYRGPNSKVGKAGKRSGHARTLKDGSSGAIDIVPVDKSPAGWARLEQQLRSPEVQQFLASFGGTILDERDAATMRKTGATGQHFHIGLGVMGGGNFYNQPATEPSYARRSPISVFSPIQSSTVDDGSTAPWYAQGSGMTDEDWAALYNASMRQLVPTTSYGTFPNLV